MKVSCVVLILAGSLCAYPAIGQGTRADYRRAESRLPDNLKLPNLNVTPHWIGQGDRFWYQRDTVKGTEFVIVDGDSGDKRAAFDHARLGKALGAVSGETMQASRLPLQRLDFESATRLRVDWAGHSAMCDLDRYVCAAIDLKPARTGEVLSPDGRWAAYVQDHNLHVRSVATGQSRALTVDGTAHNAYAVVTESHLYTISWVLGLPLQDYAHASARVVWSPDSRRLLTYRVDERAVPELPFVQSVPKQGYGHRPVLRTARVAFPGDAETATSRLLIFDVADGRRTDLDIEPLFTHYDLIEQGRLWWSASAKQVFFFRDERGFRHLQLMAADTASGKVREVLGESSPTWLWPAYRKASVVAPGEGEDVFWLSERSGWKHLYRYDGASGKLAATLTSGNWRVDDIRHVDSTGRWVYFVARGREAGRDPYYQHLYRVRFDGSDLELLTPENAQHEIQFSPNGRYYLDRYSRVDTAPVTVLRRTGSDRAVALERTDISELLAQGWQKPERFKVKARDGKTDIYGVMYRPAHFDPQRKYPVLDYIYGGPQMIFAPTAFAPGPPTAELGFIVVQIDGMGTPGRSRAFQDVSYGKGFAEAGGLQDHISGLRELAQRYPFIDLERVGIYGNSGGGYASTRAMLDYPDFYKVAVSSGGSHDQNLYQLEWGEHFLGRPAWPDADYLRQANSHDVGRLRGKLLLVHGELDDDVHPVNTMQLADALMKANKDFDLLIMTGQNHKLGEDPYFLRRQWDYFVRNLMGVEPPAGYRVGGG